MPEEPIDGVSDKFIEDEIDKKLARIALRLPKDNLIALRRKGSHRNGELGSP